MQAPDLIIHWFRLNDNEFKHNKDWPGFNDDMTNTSNDSKFGCVEWMDAFFDPTNIDYKVIDRCIDEGKYTLENNLHDITSFHEKYI